MDWLPTDRYERDKLQVRIGARCGCGTMQPDPALRARSLKAERHVLVDWLSAVVSCIAIDRACIAIDRARHSEGSALGSATPVLAQPTAFPMLCVACCLQPHACCMLMLPMACWLLRHAMPFDKNRATRPRSNVYVCNVVRCGLVVRQQEEPVAIVLRPRAVALHQRRLNQAGMPTRRTQRAPMCYLR